MRLAVSAPQPDCSHIKGNTELFIPQSAQHLFLWMVMEAGWRSHLLWGYNTPNLWFVLTSVENLNLLVAFCPGGHYVPTPPRLWFMIVNRGLYTSHLQCATLPFVTEAWPKYHMHPKMISQWAQHMEKMWIYISTCCAHWDSKLVRFEATWLRAATYKCLMSLISGPLRTCMAYQLSNTYRF